MRLLFIGRGSIAKQHIQAWKTIDSLVQIEVLSPSLSGSPFPEFLSAHRVYFDAAEIENWDYDLVLICNATYQHASSLRSLRLEKVKSIFFEKPLASDIGDLVMIQNLLTPFEDRFFYGCQLRFHPLLKRVQELIKNQKILAYTFYSASFLPDWRENASYQSYSSYKARGGGVTLDLIHEYDFATLLFGDVKHIHLKEARLSQVTVDSVDYSVGLVEHQGGVHGSIQLSYFRREPKRSIEILGDGFLIEGDLVSGQLKFSDFRDHASSFLQDCSIASKSLLLEQTQTVRDFIMQGKGYSKLAEVVNLNKSILEAQIRKN